MRTNTYTKRPQFPVALCSLIQEVGRTHHPTVRVGDSKPKTKAALPLKQQNLSTKPCSISTPKNLSMYTYLYALRYANIHACVHKQWAYQCKKPSSDTVPP